MQSESEQRGRRVPAMTSEYLASLRDVGVLRGGVLQVCDPRGLPDSRTVMVDKATAYKGPTVTVVVLQLAVVRA